MKTSQITPRRLNEMLGENNLYVVDVLPPDFFQKKHIKRAVNAPVYEMAFLEHIEKIEPSKDAVIVVYDSSKKSLASADAAEKLLTAGFSNVQELSGGMEAWEEKGFETEGSGEYSELDFKIKDGKHKIDVKESVVEWIGRSPVKSHNGTIQLSSGEIETKDGQLKNAHLILDMRSIVDLDLEDKKMRNYLESHLKSIDFFDVDNFPKAELKLVGTNRIQGATPGTANQLVKAHLTMKDVTDELEFEIQLTSSEPNIVNLSGNFDFDRTKWNVKYGSGRIFEMLGMHLVNDSVSISFHLKTK